MLMCGLVVTRALLETPGARSPEKPVEKPLDRASPEEIAADEERAVARPRALKVAQAEPEIGDDRDLQPELPFSPPIAPASRSAWRAAPEPARRIERAGRQERQEREDRQERVDQAESEREPRRQRGSLTARLRAVMQRKEEHPLPFAAPPSAAQSSSTPPPARPLPPPAPPPELIGVPVSAIEDFAHNLHAAGVDGSQIAVFGTAP